MPANKDVFDDIWDGNAPSYELYSGMGLMAILDIHPATPGHVLVVPRECTPSWQHLEPHRLSQMMALSRLVARHQADVLGLVGAYGSELHIFGDEVPHAHAHLTPKYHRGEVVSRMQPDSGRLQEAVDHTALQMMQQRLAFSDELAAAADAELNCLQPPLPPPSGFAVRE